MADPVSLGTLALGQIAGGITSLFAGKKTDAAPTTTEIAAPPTPPPVQDPVGTRSGAGVQPQKPSFVGSSAVPQQQGYGGKSLLGQ